MIASLVCVLILMRLCSATELHGRPDRKPGVATPPRRHPLCRNTNALPATACCVLTEIITYLALPLRLLQSSLLSLSLLSPPPPSSGDITWHEDNWHNDESRFLAFTLHHREAG